MVNGPRERSGDTSFGFAKRSLDIRFLTNVFFHTMMERLQHRSSHYFTKLFNLAFSDFSEAKRCFERMGFPTHGSYLLLAPLSCFRHGASLEMTESAVALGVVGIDRLGGLGGGSGGGGAVPNFRFAGPFWPKNGPLWAARKRRKHRKYQQKWP